MSLLKLHIRQFPSSITLMEQTYYRASPSGLIELVGTELYQHSAESLCFSEESAQSSGTNSTNANSDFARYKDIVLISSTTDTRESEISRTTGNTMVGKGECHDSSRIV